MVEGGDLFMTLCVTSQLLHAGDSAAGKTSALYVVNLCRNPHTCMHCSSGRSALLSQHLSDLMISPL